MRAGDRLASGAAGGAAGGGRLTPGLGATSACYSATNARRQLFNLRQELLCDNPTPERSAQILSEVERLRAEQAATWNSLFMTTSANGNRLGWPPVLPRPTERAFQALPPADVGRPLQRGWGAVGVTIDSKEYP